MILKLCTRSRWRNQNGPADHNRLTMIKCQLNCMRSWRGNRSIGIVFRGFRGHTGFRCLYLRCLSIDFGCCSGFRGLDFWHRSSFRHRISFSHDDVMGFSGDVGGCLRIVNLHFRSWRVGHVLLENNILVDGGVATLSTLCASSSSADAAVISCAILASDSDTCIVGVTWGLGPLRSLRNAGDACGDGVCWASKSLSSCTGEVACGWGELGVSYLCG